MSVRTGSRGRLQGQIQGSCEDYGIEDGNVTIIIRTLMLMRAEKPVHWMDMGAGVLLFAELREAQGVIYIYEKKERQLWGLDFERGFDVNDDQFFTRYEFEQLEEEYRLSDYAANPVLLKPFAKLKDN